MEETETMLEEEVKINPAKKKKSFIRGLIKFFIVVGFLVIILGFIFPGLLWPKNLGISYTKEDYDSFMNKLEYIKDDAPSSGKAEDYEYNFGELTEVEVEFTSEELTAFFNYNRPDYFAVKKVQIRINEDNSIEATGVANVDYFLNEILGDKYSRHSIKKEIPALGFLPKKVNIYLDFGGSVINNKTTGTLNTVTVQGIKIPSKYIQSSEAITTVTDGVNNLINNHNKSGGSFKKISVDKSKILFEGLVPSSLERIKK